jgi:hypothetical protein
MASHWATAAFRTLRSAASAVSRSVRTSFARATAALTRCTSASSSHWNRTSPEGLPVCSMPETLAQARSRLPWATRTTPAIPVVVEEIDDASEDAVSRLATRSLRCAAYDVAAAPSHSLPIRFFDRATRVSPASSSAVDSRDQAAAALSSEAASSQSSHIPSAIAQTAGVGVGAGPGSGLGVGVGSGPFGQVGPRSGGGGVGSVVGPCCGSYSSPLALASSVPE